MARLPRFVIPDQPQHVIVRGNNRDAIWGWYENHSRTTTKPNGDIKEERASKSIWKDWGVENHLTPQIQPTTKSAASLCFLRSAEFAAL